MFLEEGLALDTNGCAQERQWPADDMWGDITPDLAVVVRKPFLGDALVGPVDPVRMGEADGSA